MLLYLVPGPSILLTTRPIVAEPNQIRRAPRKSTFVGIEKSFAHHSPPLTTAGSTTSSFSMFHVEHFARFEIFFHRASQAL